MHELRIGVACCPTARELHCTTADAVEQQATEAVTYAAKVYAAVREWEDFDTGDDPDGEAIREDLRDNVLVECADLLQSTYNVVSLLGERNFRLQMQACARRREDRGRADG